jgi:hypothetical protein
MFFLKKTQMNLSFKKFMLSFYLTLLILWILLRFDDSLKVNVSFVMLGFS